MNEKHTAEWWAVEVETALDFVKRLSAGMACLSALGVDTDIITNAFDSEWDRATALANKAGTEAVFSFVACGEVPFIIRAFEASAAIYEEYGDEDMTTELRAYAERWENVAAED